MRPWIALKRPGTVEEWYLPNNNSTPLIFNQRINQGIIDSLMEKLTLAKLPFGYTEGLKEVYFTFLPDVRGDYFDGKIRLCCATDFSVIDTTFAHELGHHLDAMETISSRPKIMEEHRNSLLKAPAGGKSNNRNEYIAIGFELYYFGGRGAKENLKRENPKLYNVIYNLDRKYRVI